MNTTSISPHPAAAHSWHLLAGRRRQISRHLPDEHRNMGRFNSKKNEVVQVLNIAQGLRGGPVWWQRSAANAAP